MRGTPLAVRLLPLVLSLAGCGGKAPIEDRDVAIHLETTASEVDFGRPFELTVVRVWAKDLQPEAWDDRKLEPLSLRALKVETREDGHHIEESRHFAAHAFARETAVVPGLVFKAFSKDDGSERRAVTEGFRLKVRSALDPEAPGEVEWPEGPLEVPGRSWFTIVGIGAGVLVILLMILEARRRAARRAAAVVVAPSAEPVPAPADRARDRLDRLRLLDPSTTEEVQAFHVEVADLVRDYLAESMDLQAPEQTTEEFLASPRTLGALRDEHRRLLEGFLTDCDLVKFANVASTKAGRETLLLRADRLVNETAGTTLPEVPA